MMPLRGTLLCDGSSDRMLLPIIRWLLHDLGVPSVDIRWADPGLFPINTRGLAAKAHAAIDLEPCEILFVHRDAERETLYNRLREIRDELTLDVNTTPFICIVPVRMSEAWFLFHEDSIRMAAGNPSGRQQLGLPLMDRMESLPNPKTILHNALRRATNLTGRRRQLFNRGLWQSVLRIGDYISEYSPLRQLSAFQAFESELKVYLERRSLLISRGRFTTPH